MKFGFIAHPVGGEDIQLFEVVDAFQSFPILPSRKNRCARPKDVDEAHSLVFSGVTSLNGAVCDGKVRYLSVPPLEILENQTESVEKVIEAAQKLVDWGAEIIGLGGYTGIIGSRGLEAKRRLPVPVTTGNSYTVHTSVEVLEYICSRLDTDLREEPIVVIGFPGSIGLAIVRTLLRKNAGKLVLVGRRAGKYLEKLVPTLGAPQGTQIDICDNVEKGVKKGRFLLSATSSGEIIDQNMLLPGSVVIDIAYPKDVAGVRNERSDVLIIDGGRFSLSPEVSMEGPLGFLLRNNLHSCLGETILLAWEDKRENFSLGRELDVERIAEIGALGKKHGFVTDALYSFGRPLDYRILANVRKLRFKESPSKLKQLLSFDDALSASTEEVFDRFASYVNPTLSHILHKEQANKTFRKASGIFIWDDQGERYYDFIGGYGSVNIGHNAPAVLETVRALSEAGLPGMLQAFPGKMSTALARNLVMLAPENLEICFFGNSGAEANEGALKLARACTGKSRIVFTHNSFHGKTLGALSVTGRSVYKEPFEPLLPDCTGIPYADLDALEEVLSAGDVAAFILEPIQGEGGVIVPPAGYLTGVRDLCSEYQALMILDEVQTGFGRTGKMFACEHEGVQPDILTLAKSLGGGLVPIGAYITTREIWEKAYGTLDRFLMHTSTFGGNNFSAAVALTAIRTIFEGELIENAARLGAYFLERLKELRTKYEIIAEVRGQGLMIGIEFRRVMDSAWERMREELSGMVNRNILSSFRMLPLDLRSSMEETLSRLEQHLKGLLTESLCARLSSALFRDHHILTLTTMNNPNVMRVQPPLCIAEDQIDYFVTSLDSVCGKHRL